MKKPQTKSRAALGWLTPTSARNLLRLIAEAQRTCSVLEVTPWLVGAAISALGEDFDDPRFLPVGDARAVLQAIGDRWTCLADSEPAGLQS